MIKKLITKLCRKIMSARDCHEGPRTPDGCHPMPPLPGF